MSFLESFLNPDRVDAMLAAALPKVLAALAVLVVFWLVLKVTQPGLRRVLGRARFAEALIKLTVDGLYRGTMILLAFVMAASQLGINVSALLAGLGVVGIAVGFAAQETVANMIAGFLIFWDRPFKVGDFITTAGKYGEVREITMRTTRIRTPENTFIVIPNKQIIGELMVNHSMYGETRVNVPIGIAYKETVAEARRALLAAVARLDDVLETPAPDVVVKETGDSSVNLEVRVWIDDASRERPVFHQVIEASKLALDEAGIEIPFPHLQLFVDDVRPRVWDQAARFPEFAGRAG